MAKSHTYLVSFSPAERGDGYHLIRFTVGATSATHEITASSFDELKREVYRLAGRYGRTCSPFIRMKGGARKPAGFDQWRKTVNIIEVPSNAEIEAYIAKLAAADAAMGVE